MDDLSTTPLSQIDWDFVAVWRILTILILLVLVLQMVMMLSHYWHWLMPLRREVEKGAGVRLVAPPVGWTFAYHVVVTVLLVFVGIGLAQNVYHERGATLFTYAGPVLAGSLLVIVNRFLKYYSHTLGESHRQASRPG